MPDLQDKHRNLPASWPTVPELLRRATTEFPDRIAFIRRKEGEVQALTYGELGSRVDAIARATRAAGINQGDRIALWSENCLEWPLVYFGAMCSGATVVPLDAMLSTAEAEYLLRRARVKLLFFHPKLLESVHGIAQYSEVEIVSLSDLDSFVDTPLKVQTELPSSSPDDLAVIIFTSGTTGHSKGVMLTHSNLTSDALGVIKSVHINEGDNFHLLLPLHHTYSSTVNLLCALAGGARATFATSYKSRDIVDDIRIAAVTILIGVPQVYENLMKGMLRAVREAGRTKLVLFKSMYVFSTVLEFIGIRAGKPLFVSLRKKAGLSTLRLLVSGGAALRPEVNRFFLRLGFDLVQGYGLTETSPVLTVNPPERNKVGTVGPPVHGVELKIDNPDADGIGEICARGPMIMRGYFEDAEKTDEVLRNGCFHTGDAGKLSTEGYLHITGRLKNVIITAAGKNVYPEEIEAQLMTLPLVHECLILGIERKRGGGEELFALIYPEPPDELPEATHDPENLRREIDHVIRSYNSGVPAYKRIRGWLIRDREFEKASTLKIKRYLYIDEATRLARES